MTATLSFCLACLMAVGGLLLAERAGHAVGRVLFKLGASTCFVAVALDLGAADSVYGRWVLAALLLGWVGDACLLSGRAGPFMAGLGSFLLSHLCYAVAFFGVAQSGPALAAALGVAAVAGVFVRRWLWRHLAPADKLPVAAYMATIFVMCAAAVGLGGATGHWLPAVGAIVFAVSDLFVARDRFIVDQWANKLWGLPAYYVAQLVMAFSVASWR